MTGSSPTSFPPSARLHVPRQFQAALRDGKRSHGRYFRLHVLAPVPERPAPAIARLGVTVSKRVDKRAVERNRVKRAVRESFRQIRASLPPGDYLLVAKSECSGVADLRMDLAALWTRALSLNAAGATGTMPGPTPTPSVPAP